MQEVPTTVNSGQGGPVVTGGFVGYPMVEESEATGAVAAVYARLRKHMPFVPSLFKSLALCPGYLVLAAEQAAGALSDTAMRRSGSCPRFGRRRYRPPTPKSAPRWRSSPAP